MKKHASSASHSLPPAVIVGAHTVGLGVLRALSQLDITRVVVSYDPKDMGRGSRYITTLVDAPHPESQEDAFINSLVRLADRYPGAILFPASDASLTAISRRKTELGQYYHVACTEWSITEQYIDKKRTYALAEAQGVPAPRTVVADSEETVRHYAQTVDFPCLVKPCQSHRYFDKFQRKMVFANNLDEMLAAYRQAADAGLEVMLQEFIPGDDTCGVNYNSYWWEGQPLVEFTARKVRNAPPDTGSPCVAMSAKVPEVFEYGRRVLNAMGFFGFACTEFKRDPRDGIYKLMEVNGRHNLSSLLAVRCGLNFPVLHYRHLALNELPHQIPFEEGVYWIDLTRDMTYSTKRWLSGRYPFKRLIEPYRHRHIFAILDWRDPKPFLKRLTQLVKDAMRGQRSL